MSTEKRNVPKPPPFKTNKVRVQKEAPDVYESLNNIDELLANAQALAEDEVGDVSDILEAPQNKSEKSDIIVTNAAAEINKYTETEEYQEFITPEAIDSEIEETFSVEENNDDEFLTFKEKDRTAEYSIESVSFEDDEKPPKSLKINKENGKIKLDYSEDNIVPEDNTKNELYEGSSDEHSFEAIDFDIESNNINVDTIAQQDDIQKIEESINLGLDEDDEYSETFSFEQDNKNEENNKNTVSTYTHLENNDDDGYDTAPAFKYEVAEMLEYSSPETDSNQTDDIIDNKEVHIEDIANSTHEDPININDKVDEEQEVKVENYTNDDLEEDGDDDIENQEPKFKDDPIKFIDKKKQEKEITIKSGEGTKIFFGKKNSKIILQDKSINGWRLFLTNTFDEDMNITGGQTIKIPQESDMTTAFLYNKTNNSLINSSSGEAFTFPYKSKDWKMLSVSMKEISLNTDIINLDHKNGLLVGPKGTTLFFYNVSNITIDTKKYGDYKAPNYNSQDIKKLEDGNKSFAFSMFHENTIFEGDDEINTISLECEDNSTYGWNVKFSNGLFMSINDIIEYQNRNQMLPFDEGVLYHGANRLEFSGVKSINVYKKPYYYGYGLSAE